MTETEIGKKNSKNLKMKKALKTVWDFLSDMIFSAVTVIGVVILIRFIIISPFEVSGGSMLDTLHDEDYIIVDKLSYRFSEPERGDIVVLVPPINTDTYYIKRIVGLPGEKIEFSNGQVLIHNAEFPAGFKLKEEYLSEKNKDSYLPNHESRSIQIPKNHYFVMGDNRGGSNDSRQWGTLHERNIEGRAWLLVLPFSRTSVISGVEYGM